METKNLQFTFNRDKAIAAILYIASKVEDPTFLRIAKIFYFADKTSLGKFGRFIAGDTYVAMQHGPVPGNTYDLMKQGNINREIGFKIEREREIVPLAPPDMGELSESDIECLDIAIANYGRASIKKLRGDSHDKAWLEAWDNKGNQNSAIMPLESIVNLLDNSDDLLEFLITQHDD